MHYPSYIIDGFGVIGRGHSSVIIKAELLNGDEVAIKLLRTDSKRDSLLSECRALKMAYPVSPYVIVCDDEFIIMEFIEGLTLGQRVRGLRNCEELIKLGLKVLGSARYLDIVEVDHRELSIPKKHVIVDRLGRVRIIDFESVRFGKACNVNRIASWFLMRSGITEECCRDHESLIKLARNVLREYKRLPTHELFKELIKLITNSCIR